MNIQSIKKLILQDKTLFGIVLASFVLFLFFTLYFYRGVLAPSVTESIRLFPFKYCIEGLLILIFLISSITLVIRTKTRWLKYLGISLALISLFLTLFHGVPFILYGFSHSFALSEYYTEFGPTILKQLPSPDGQKQANVFAIPSAWPLGGSVFHLEIEYRHTKTYQTKQLLLFPHSFLGFWNDMRWKDNDTLIIMNEEFSIHSSPKMVHSGKRASTNWNR